MHFFAPDDLQPLPKHIVFVLDTSGSMGFGSRKIEQLKEAMKNILSQLQSEDNFSIIEFNSNIFVWDINAQNKRTLDITNYYDPFSQVNVVSKIKAIYRLQGSIWT